MYNTEHRIQFSVCVRVCVRVHGACIVHDIRSQYIGTALVYRLNGVYIVYETVYIQRHQYQATCGGVCVCVGVRWLPTQRAQNQRRNHIQRNNCMETERARCDGVLYWTNSDKPKRKNHRFNGNGGVWVEDDRWLVRRNVFVVSLRISAFELNLTLNHE